MSHPYNFAYLDEQSKKNIRRALLKALAIPGFQVPFTGREMPLPSGWGAGAVQVTASLLGKTDTLKVIDQGADDTISAVSIKDFFRKTAGISVTDQTPKADIIQTRHRIPETPLKKDQIIVFQTEQPDPLRSVAPKKSEAAKMHAFAEYGSLYVKLYDDIARFGRITTPFNHPVLVHNRYIMSPSRIPKCDNAKLDNAYAIHLFAAGRERRIYAVPPHTRVKSLDFEDYPFEPDTPDRVCDRCGSPDSYLDEIVTHETGPPVFVCSDTEYCRRKGKRGIS